METNMNRRSRARFKTDLTVMVTCLEIGGDTIKARMADLSVHGLSLILNKELHIGSRVRVEWGNLNFTGETVYCENHGKEFLAGLKVEASVYETARRDVLRTSQ
jgi:PilZ domain